MKFADIPGQEQVKERLRQMYNDNRLPHAILLQGPSGTGKYALARAFAQYIHCTAPASDGEPCGKCPSCLQHESFNHIDTIFSYPVVKKAGNTSSPVTSDDYAQQWKEFLQKDIFMAFDGWLDQLDNPTSQPQMYVFESESLMRKLSFTAHASAHKIVLMWLPERMNEQCANKLLKLIEEPFSDTLFILTSDNPGEILPTIYSRCQPINVSRLSETEIAQWLEHARAVDPSEASIIAHNAQGSLSTALKLLKTTKADKAMLDSFISLMRLAYTRNVIELRAWANNLAANGRENQIHFLNYCARLLRENFIFNAAMPQLNYLSADEAAFSRRFARFINERNVCRLVRVFDDAIADVEGNTNSKMVFFDLAVKVILLLK